MSKRHTLYQQILSLYSTLTHRQLPVVHALLIAVAAALVSGCYSTPKPIKRDNIPFNSDYYQLLSDIKREHLAVLDGAAHATVEENRLACDALLDQFSPLPATPVRQQTFTLLHAHAIADCGVLQIKDKAIGAVALSVLKLKIVALYERALQRERLRKKSTLKTQLQAVDAQLSLTSL